MEHGDYPLEMDPKEQEEEKVRFEVSSKNKEEYIKKRTQEDYNK